MKPLGDRYDIEETPDDEFDNAFARYERQQAAIERADWEHDERRDRLAEQRDLEREAQP